MAQKRERNNNSNDDPPYKKRKIINNKSSSSDENQNKNPWKFSEVLRGNENKNTADKKHFNQIYNTINECELINNMKVPVVMVVKITDFAIGNVIIPCWNEKCQHKLSFLQQERFLRFEYNQKCVCDTDQYLIVCNFCQKDCCIPNDDKDRYCHNGNCRKRFLCHDHLNQCCECGNWWCSDCWDIKANQMYCFKCINDSL